MAEQVARVAEHIRREMGRAVVGQRAALDQLLQVLLCGGHALIEGVPGLAKTLAVKSLSQVLGLEFSRVQSTPDLMPADILGTNIYRTATQAFELHRGPVFTGFLLVDEVNRMPPRTQAALLECMEERQVTIDGVLGDIAGVGPLLELLDDPGQLADGGVGERVGERLGPGGLDTGVAGHLVLPALHELQSPLVSVAQVVELARWKGQ